jgi:DNA transformation protein and related proteins
MRGSKIPKSPGFKRSAQAGDTDVLALLGLGEYSRRVLMEIGLTTRADLERVGPVAAFVAAKSASPRVSLNLLWGIAGAISDTHWTNLTSDYKAELLREYDACCDLHGNPKPQASKMSSPSESRAPSGRRNLSHDF